VQSHQEARSHSILPFRHPKILRRAALAFRATEPVAQGPDARVLCNATLPDELKGIYLDLTAAMIRLCG
jgi:hypothetical protein